MTKTRISALLAAVLAAPLLAACAGEEVVVQRKQITLVNEVLVAAPAVETTEVEVVRQELSPEDIASEVVRIPLDLSDFETTQTITLDPDTSVVNDTPATLDAEPAGPRPESGIGYTPTKVVSTVQSGSVSFSAGYFNGTLEISGAPEGYVAPTAAGEDGFVAIHDVNGTLQEVFLFSSENLDAVYGMLVYEDAVVIHGAFQGSMEVAGVTLSSLGESDIFVALVNPAGVAWVRQIGTSGYDILTDAAYIDNSGTIVMAGSVDGGANGSDGVVCSVNPSDGSMICERSVTSASDRFTEILGPSEAEGFIDVTVEETNSSGTDSNQVISVEAPESASTSFTSQSVPLEDSELSFDETAPVTDGPAETGDLIEVPATSIGL